MAGCLVFLMVETLVAAAVVKMVVLMASTEADKSGVMKALRLVHRLVSRLGLEKVAPTDTKSDDLLDQPLENKRMRYEYFCFYKVLNRIFIPDEN